jgi:hypothetical protein
MATTDRYVKLAGVVFRKEAEAQAARLLGTEVGYRTWYPTERTSSDLR